MRWSVTTSFSLNAPLVAGSPGVPSVVTTNASLSVEPVCR